MADQAAKAAAQVHRKDRDGLAWLELDAPPLNLLSFALRAALWQAVETTNMSEEARILLFNRAASAMANHMADLLRVCGGSTEPSRMIAEHLPSPASE